MDDNVGNIEDVPSNLNEKVKGREDGVGSHDGQGGDSAVDGHGNPPMGGVDTKDNEDPDKGSEKSETEEGSEKSESEEDDVNDMDFVPAGHKPEVDGDDVLEGDVIREKDALVDDLSEALEHQMLNEARKERAASSTRKHLGFLPLNRS